MSVSEIAAFISEHGALGGKLLQYYHQLEDAKKAIGEQYAGQYESLSDFAQEISQQSETIPDNLAFYIDYEKMARDMEINDVLAIKTSHDQVHVFWAF